MSTPFGFRVVFPEWYDERGEWEAKDKGWLDGVGVHFTNGEVRALCFYDPVRLAQDLASETKQGKPIIALRGLIVLPEITRDAIVGAIPKLVVRGYFSLRPEFEIEKQPPAYFISVDGGGFKSNFPSGRVGYSNCESMARSASCSGTQARHR